MVKGLRFNGLMGYDLRLRFSTVNLLFTTWRFKPVGITLNLPAGR
jgi:hypothetical protein